MDKDTKNGSSTPNKAQTGTHTSAGKIAAWAVATIVAIVVLLPLSLYIPWVQNAVKDVACRYASEATGMSISVDRILIKFPLKMSVDGVAVLDSARDTMVVAGNLTANVALRPLLDKRVSLDEASLSDGAYRMLSEDSSMLLKARVRLCQIRGTLVDLNRREVNLPYGDLRGGNVSLVYRPDKVKHKPDTAKTEPWRVTVGHLTLADVDYAMSMQPTIDTLTTHIGSARLDGGIVDMAAHTVDADYFGLDSVSCDYRYPTAEWARRYTQLHPVEPDTFPPADTATWQIRGKQVSLTRSSAVYALKGAKPASRGLDMNHIAVSGINLSIANLYNQGVNVKVPITSLKATERCGVGITEAKGTFAMTQSSIDVRRMELHTLLSDILLDTHLDMSLLDTKPTGIIRLDTRAAIALQDVQRLVPALAPMLKGVPQLRPIALEAKIKGNPSHVAIERCVAEIPRYARAEVSGTADNVLDSKRLAGNLAVKARLLNINFVKPMLLDAATQRQVGLPPMDVTANAKFNSSSIAGDAVMRLATGSLAGKGHFSANSQGYGIDATLTTFPVQAVLPLMGIGNVTAHITASGHGFDFTSPKTAVKANVDLGSIVYNKAEYRNMRANVDMGGGHIKGTLDSSNPNCDLYLQCDATQSGDNYDFDVTGNINDLDLHALNLYSGVCRGNGMIKASGSMNLRRNLYDVKLDLNDLNWTVDSDALFANSASLNFVATDSSVTAGIIDEGTTLDFSAGCGLNALMSQFERSYKIAMGQYEKRSLNIDTLQRALPHFALNLQMGSDGMIQRYLDKYDVDFRKVSMNVRNDSTIFIDGLVHSLSIGSTAIDTITLHAQESKNKYLAFNAHMGNRPGTFDEFASVTMRGGIGGPVLNFLVEQQNIKRETGYRVGVNAALTDTAVNMRFFPQQPVIGYRKWNVNDSNYVIFNYLSKMLKANLQLESDSSLVSLQTHPAGDAGKENINLKLANVRIQEWMKFMPDMPPMTGVLNADMDVAYDGKNLEGNGKVALNNFVYNDQPQGNYEMNTRLTIDPSTASTTVNADVNVDGSQVALAYGSLNDSTSHNPFNLKMKLDHFPLCKASAFIPGGLVALGGYLDGDLSVTGSMQKPVINGYLMGDSAVVQLPRYGSSMALASSKIPIDSNVVRLDNYKIMGLNNRPVTANGVVNMRDMQNMIIDLRLDGSNVQFIGSEQKSSSEVFGKAFANLACSVRGRGNYMDAQASLTLLPGSNITYVLQDEVSNLTTQVDENMVRFVSGRDSLSWMNLKTQAAASAMNVRADIDVQQGAKINAYLSADGKDRVQIDGSGKLKYTLDFAGKSNMVGSYTIESGSVRYSPPLISQKIFNFVEGSRITWTGDLMNPQLDITATESLKTSVNSGGEGSRLVDFVITATVGNSLSNMSLDFDMSANNDMTVQNELQGMTPPQRSQAAINLLLYNSYSGLNSTGSMNLSTTGALYSFLQSQLNSWAASNLKGIDLTFGINQYDQSRNGKSQTETSYSYRLSKTLFNDRFKIVVGGEYSTDATSEQNFSQNLINDISFEYNLNASGTKYLRLFRHTGFESILEGEVTEMGAGFVIKRKLSTLRHLFRYRSPERIAEDSAKAAREAARKAAAESPTQQHHSK
ncbi:MAG: translocation/assembly module TamB domain-containing protein [Sodaliphilus sp.]|nr:translocation/assembly module TamB domain-containing protein [Sodaliphilus sp.]